MSKQPSISYKDAGVDIDAGEALVEIGTEELPPKALFALAEAFEQGMLLNMGQLLSIPFILLGIYMIYRGMHRSPVDPDTVRVVRQQTVRQQGGSSKPRKHRRMK